MVTEATEIDVHWPDVLSGLVRGQDMSRDVAQHVVTAMLAGQASDAQIAGFLISMAAKGETTEEILGMRDAMFAASTPLELPDGTVDIVGVGGAPRRQVAAFNVSTIASIVAAAAGATVCKHGNRKASSTSGSVPWALPPTRFMRHSTTPPTANYMVGWLPISPMYGKYL